MQDLDMQCAETGPLRVLLVERDHDQLLHIQRLLQASPGGSRFVLHCAGDAEGVLEACSRLPYDVCLFDERTLSARLHEVLERVAATGHMPVLLLTEGTGHADDAQRGIAVLSKATLDGPMLANAIQLALDRQRAGQPTHASERQFRAVFEGALDAMVITDEAGNYVDGNPAALSLLGVDASTLRRLRVADVVVRDEHEAIGTQWTTFLEEGHLEGQVVMRRSDGELRTAEFRATANIMPGRHLSVLRDVTERRATEERLALAERMACVGTMAAGVAHEINNPLTAVMAKLELAESALSALAREVTVPPRSTGSLASVFDQLAGAREGAARIMSIVHDVKLFSSAADDHAGAVDVHVVLASALRMADNELRHRARVITNYGKVPHVLGNESRLGQVFLNLLVNAAQAIPEGRADQNEVRISSWFDAPSSMVVVEIADTGIGMSRETAARVFTPFFTTKPPGVGLGVGLAICQRLVSALGGCITTSSELGRGSAFRVALPSGSAPARSDPILAPPAPPRASVPRRARLLVIDDEASICSAVVCFFEGEHDVTAVTRARDALARFERGERFDVIFCDLMMPEMTGIELHGRLRTIAPDAADRIVFWTGGAFTQRARDFMAEVGNDCIQKPFMLRTLQEIVNATLSSTRREPA